MTLVSKRGRGKWLVFSGMVLLLCFMLMWLFLFYQKRTPQEKIFPSCVRIAGSSYYGNGTILKKKDDMIVIVTAAHVINNNEKLKIYFYTGKSTDVIDKIRISEKHDVAFLTINGNELDQNTFQSIRAAKTRISGLNCLQQEEPIAYGYLDENLIARLRKGRLGNKEWYLEEFQEKVLYNYCKADKGMSGCGTFDSRGNYIGMLLGGTKEDESVSLPYKTIASEYKTITPE